MLTLCGTPEVVTSVSVTDITASGMTFRWAPPMNYNGNINNAQYEVSTLVSDLYKLSKRLYLTIIM